MGATNEIEQEVEGIYEAFSAELLAYASTFVRREDCAADAVQEVFLRYFMERSYGRSIENPRSWLYRVLRNYLCDRLDRAALKRELPVVDFDSFPDPARGMETAVERVQTAEKITAQFLNAKWNVCSYGRPEQLITKSPVLSVFRWVPSVRC